MFMPKQPIDIPPKARILIIGGPPADDLGIIARNLCTLMNAHLCATKYVGSLTSLKEYDAHALFQGEMVVVSYATNYKYQQTDNKKFDLVFYVNQPNLGLSGKHNDEEYSARLSEHVYYLTLQTLLPEVVVINNTNRSFTDVVGKMLDRVTLEWPIFYQKEINLEDYLEEHGAKTVNVAYIGHGSNTALIYRAIEKITEGLDMREDNLKELLERPKFPEDPEPTLEPKVIRVPMRNSSPTGAGRMRNMPCRCGSGKKYKKCCLLTDGR